MKQIIIERGWGKPLEEDILITLVRNKDTNHKTQARRFMDLANEFSSGTIDEFVLSYLGDCYNHIPKSIMVKIKEVVKKRDLEADTLSNKY
jgi:hypothetical protein